MKSISSTATGALVGRASVSFYSAVAMDDHTVLKPNDVKWGPGPASIRRERRHHLPRCVQRRSCLPYG